MLSKENNNLNTRACYMPGQVLIIHKYMKTCGSAGSLNFKPVHSLKVFKLRKDRETDTVHRFTAGGKGLTGHLNRQVLESGCVNVCKDICSYTHTHT